MADVSEVFDGLETNAKDTVKNFKEFLKKHPFAIAVIVVALVALFAAFRKSGSNESDQIITEAGGQYYIPSGYGGYPQGFYDEYFYTDSSDVTGNFGGSSSSSSTTTDTSTDTNTNTEVPVTPDDGKRPHSSGGGGSSLSRDDETVFAYEQLLGEYATLAQDQAGMIAFQNAIAQMSANSEMYAQTRDKALKEQLHAENLAIADQYGLTFDSKTGNYFYKDGSPVYLAAWQKLQGVTPVLGHSQSVVDKNHGSIGYDSFGNQGYAQNLKTFNGVTYDVTVDYAAKMQEAYNAGYHYNDEEFQNLLTLRNAKIQGEGLDPETGKKIAASKSSAYSGVTSSVNTNTAGKTTSQITYDRNTDYAALINQAKASGASQATIDQLTAQREAKIKGENLNADGTPKS